MDKSDPQLRADNRALQSEVQGLKRQLADRQTAQQRDAVVAGLRAEVERLKRENAMLERRLME